MKKSLQNKLNELRGHLANANRLFGEIMEELGDEKKAPQPSKRKQLVEQLRKFPNRKT